MPLTHASSFKLPRTNNLANEQDTLLSSESSNSIGTVDHHGTNVDLTRIKAAGDFLQSRPSLQSISDKNRSPDSKQGCFTFNKIKESATPCPLSERHQDISIKDNSILSLQDRIYLQDKVIDYLGYSPIEIPEQAHLANSVKQAFNYQDLYRILSDQPKLHALHQYVINQNKNTYSRLNQLDDQKYFERALSTVWVEHQLPALERKLTEKPTPTNLLHEWFTTFHQNKPYGPLSCRLLAFEIKLNDTFHCVDNNLQTHARQHLIALKKELESINKDITIFLRAGRVTHKSSLNPLKGWHNQAQRTISKLDTTLTQPSFRTG